MENRRVASQTLEDGTVVSLVMEREDVTSVTFTGITIDVPVSDLDGARAFYRAALGRVEDLTQGVDTLEWILHDRPQVAVRVVAQRAGVGSAKVGIGVGDLHAERERLLQALDAVPEIAVVPSVIAMLELHDGDGNTLAFWQDLLSRSSDAAERRADER